MVRLFLLIKGVFLFVFQPSFIFLGFFFISICCESIVKAAEHNRPRFYQTSVYISGIKDRGGGRSRKGSFPELFIIIQSLVWLDSVLLSDIPTCCSHCIVEGFLVNCVLNLLPTFQWGILKWEFLPSNLSPKSRS